MEHKNFENIYKKQNTYQNKNFISIQKNNSMWKALTEIKSYIHMDK